MNTTHMTLISNNNLIMYIYSSPKLWKNDKVMMDKNETASLEVSNDVNIEVAN